MPNGSRCVRLCNMNDASVISLLSCAQRAFPAGTVRVGMAAQVIGAVVNAKFDGQVHPKIWMEISAHDCAHSGA